VHVERHDSEYHKLALQRRHGLLAELMRRVSNRENELGLVLDMVCRWHVSHGERPLKKCS
jgi:hypothetical protein